MAIEDPKEIERLVLVRLLRLNARILGIIFGLIAGVGLFLATNFLVLKGGEVVGPHLGLLGQFFPGYRVTFVGSLVGFAYAFVSAFCIGYLFAWFYNWIAEMRERKTPPASATGKTP